LKNKDGEAEHSSPWESGWWSSKYVVISEQRLSQYAGLYWKKDDEHAIRIVLKDGQLFVSRSEEERLELTPLSENGFQLIVFPVTFTFDEVTSGTPLRMSIQRPGEEEPDVFERVTELAKAQRPESKAKRYPTLRTADYCARLSFPVSQ
jgi:hypothetical protein